MNKFSDDDLARLKDGLVGPDDAWFDGYTVKSLKALMGRLEAAERVCEASSEKIGLHNQHCNVRHKCALPRVGESIVAWLQACGREAR